MSAFLEGIGKVIGKIADQVSGRIERLKNERNILDAEKTRLENERPVTARNIKRIIDINVRLSVIKDILSNNAKD